VPVEKCSNAGDRALRATGDRRGADDSPPYPGAADGAQAATLARDRI